jgi:hypothetical protein
LSLCSFFRKDLPSSLRRFAMALKMQWQFSAINAMMPLPLLLCKKSLRNGRTKRSFRSGCLDKMTKQVKSKPFFLFLPGHFLHLRCPTKAMAFFLRHYTFCTGTCIFHASASACEGAFEEKCSAWQRKAIRAFTFASSLGKGAKVMLKAKQRK